MREMGKGKGYGAGGQSYNAPEHKSSTVRGSHMSTDSAGVGDGLSARSDMDSESLHNVSYDESVDPLTGNMTGRPKPYSSKSISEKGHKMEIC